MLDVKSLRNTPNMKIFMPGDIIVHEGDKNRQLYIMMRGTADLYKNHNSMQEVYLGEYCMGTFFGEESLFLGSLQGATAVTTAQALVALVDHDKIFDFFRDEQIATFALIADICQRRGAVQPVQKARTIGKSTLFPQGHGDYRFPDLPEPLPDGVVFQAKETCPICGVSFQNTMLLESKLVRRQMDPDLREHYKGIEPMHYEVYTCPQCWYSALKDQFPQAEPAQPAHLLGELVTFHTELALEFDEFRDAAAVFTSYYLALHCAPRCFVNAELQIGKLWTRLAWLYTDCGDEKMTEYAHKRALEAYEIAFQHVDLSPRGLQRLYFIQGDLLYKLQRFTEAKDKFFKAKTHRGGTEMIRNYAEDRLELIRKVEKQA